MGDFLAGGRRLWVCESKITVALTATEERVTQSDGEANSRCRSRQRGSQTAQGKKTWLLPVGPGEVLPFHAHRAATSKYTFIELHPPV